MQNIKLGLQTHAVREAFAADSAYTKTALELMLGANETLKANGFKAGYHAHDGDFTNKVGEKISL